MASRYTTFLILIILSMTEHHVVSAQTNVAKAAYWLSTSNFPATTIDSTLFTHLYCAFANLDPRTNQVTISSSNFAAFSTFTKSITTKNPSIKTILSIGGGGSSNSAIFSSIASKKSSRKSFIDSSMKLARSLGFHGLDLYWEYPNTTLDMSNIGLLVNEWRSALIWESKESNKSQLLLSAAVYYTPKIASLSYPTKSMSNSLDWINIMAYNLTSPSESPTVTRPHASLFDSSLFPQNISGSQGIEAWIKSGISSKKIVFGLPFHGFAWRLLDPRFNGWNSPANGPVNFGASDGSIGYKQINEFGAGNIDRTTTFDAAVVSYYRSSGNTWINYDDFNSIFAKVAYAKKIRLLGYFAWHVGLDDNWTLSSEALQAWGA